MVQRSTLDSSGDFSTITDGVSNAMPHLGQSAFNSMEQFVTSVRIEKTHPLGAATPGFRAPSNTGDEEGKFGDDLAGPTIHELCPYFAQIFGDDGTDFFRGTDFRVLNHDQLTRTSGDANRRKAEDETPGTDHNIKVVKTANALRGPLIISGWGFGMDDLPVPQRASNFPDNTQFDSGMAGNRALWKTGPVHLMWDDERQVWQGGYPIVCGVVDGGITAPPNVCEPTQFKVNLFRNTQHIPDPRYPGGHATPPNLKLSDHITPKEVIQVQNRDPSLEQEAVPNAIFCIAIKLNYEWLPLWVGCPETPACDADLPPCIKNTTC